MPPTDLSRLDLNLMVALDALLHTRSATRAAARLGVTQSAASHALKRLRELFGDPLLVRTAEGLSPTARAQALEAPLREALGRLRDLVAQPRPFEPAHAKRTFRVAAADYGGFVLLPELIRRLAVEAPEVNVLVVSAAVEDVERLLVSGDVEAVIGVSRRGDSAAAIRERRLFEERFVVVARQGHPAVQGSISLDDYARLPHAFVAPRGTLGGVVDDVLDGLGLSRRVAVAVPQFLLVPHLVASSDLLVTLGERLALAYAKLLPLQVVAPPVPIPSFINTLRWHDRWHGDPGHAWFRGVLAEIGAAA